jgi:hypothetical protein
MKIKITISALLLTAVVAFIIPPVISEAAQAVPPDAKIKTRPQQLSPAVEDVRRDVGSRTAIESMTESRALGRGMQSIGNLRQLHPCTTCYRKLAEDNLCDLLGDLMTVRAIGNTVYVDWNEDPEGMAMLNITDIDNDGVPDTIRDSDVEMKDIAAIDLYRFVRGVEVLKEYVRNLNNAINFTPIQTTGSLNRKFEYVRNGETWTVLLTTEADGVTMYLVQIKKVGVDLLVNIESDSPYWPSIDYQSLLQVGAN